MATKAKTTAKVKKKTVTKKVKTPVKAKKKEVIKKKTVKTATKVKAKAKTKVTAKKTVAKKVVAKKAVAKKTVAKKTIKKSVAVKATPKKTSNKKVKSVIKPVETKAKKATPKTIKTSVKTTAPKLVKKVVKAVVPTPVPEAPKKPEKIDFVAGDFVVYPAHGVGQVEGVDVQTVSGIEVTLYTISFEKDRMRLKLPVSKAKSSGLRKLSSKDRLKDALATLQGRSQVRRIMWSRRAQGYETKINSGDPVSIAEVLRDLKKEEDQAEQSYSERQIYQAALSRLAREVAAIEDIAEDKAVEKLEAVLSKVA